MDADTYRRTDVYAGLITDLVKKIKHSTERPQISADCGHQVHADVCV